MKSKEAIERHIKELLSEMTVEEKLDELDPNIMGIDWEKIEEPMRRECLEKLEKRRADARVYNALQKYAKEQTRLGIPFLFRHFLFLHNILFQLLEQAMPFVQECYMPYTKNIL